MRPEDGRTWQRCVVNVAEVADTQVLTVAPPVGHGGDRLAVDGAVTVGQAVVTLKAAHTVRVGPQVGVGRHTHLVSQFFHGRSIADRAPGVAEGLVGHHWGQIPGHKQYHLDMADPSVALAAILRSLVPRNATGVSHVGDSELDLALQDAIGLSIGLVHAELVLVLEVAVPGSVGVLFADVLIGLDVHGRQSHQVVVTRTNPEVLLRGQRVRIPRVNHD